MPDDLRVGAALRRRWAPDLVAAATEQVALRRRAAGRLRDPESMLLTAAGLEQASSTAAAAHRAARIRAAVAEGGRVVDLCCGIGSDLRELVATGLHATGIDRDETHAWCARHNAAASVAVADVRDIKVDGAAAVFVDPARRSGDRRGGSEPPLAWCTALPADRVAVKAAPGLDVATVPASWEVEFVADHRDLKEACLWSPAWASASGARTATVFVDGRSLSLTADPAMPAAEVRAPGRFVLDPSPAVTRAGAVADLAALTASWQIDRRIAFLSSDSPMPTPYGRLLEVQASLPFGVKPLAAELRRLDVGTIDLRRRGLAGDVDDLRRRLRPRGRAHAVVLLTRVDDKPWALVCSVPSGTPSPGLEAS